MGSDPAKPPYGSTFLTMGITHGPRKQEAFARALLAGLMDNAGDLACEIDGQPVANVKDYRCQTPAGEAYMITLPDNNLWGIPAGTYGPAVDDGYYLMLAPLSAGQHVIHIAADNGPGVRTWT